MKIKQFILWRSYWLVFIFLLGLIGLVKMVFTGVPPNNPSVIFGSIVLLPFGYIAFIIYRTYWEYWQNDKHIAFNIDWDSKEFLFDKPVRLIIPFTELDLVTHETFAVNNFHREFYYIKIHNDLLHESIFITSILLNRIDFEKLKTEKFQKIDVTTNQLIRFNKKKIVSKDKVYQNSEKEHFLNKFEKIDSETLQQYLDNSADYSGAAIEAVSEILAKRNR